MDLRNRLASATGLALPVTLAFDYPTVRVLAGHLRAELGIGVESGVAALLAGLAAMDEAFRRQAPDGLTRMKVAVGLRGFLDRWADMRAQVDEPDDSGDTGTDDDVLRMVEQELGI